MPLPAVGDFIRITASPAELLRISFSDSAAAFFSGRIVRVTHVARWVEFDARPDDCVRRWQLDERQFEPAEVRVGDQIRLIGDATSIASSLWCSAATARPLEGRAFPVHTVCTCGCDQVAAILPEEGLTFFGRNHWTFVTHADPQPVAQPIVSSRPPPRVRRASVVPLNLP